jgi:hypothetical protein
VPPHPTPGRPRCANSTPNTVTCSFHRPERGNPFRVSADAAMV